MKKVIPFLAFLLLSTGTYAQWTQAPKLPVPAPIERLDIDGSTLYAATAYPMVGVYKSVNNGASWAKLNIDNLNEYYAIVSASGNTVTR